MGEATTNLIVVQELVLHFEGVKVHIVVTINTILHLLAVPHIADIEAELGSEVVLNSCCYPVALIVVRCQIL